MECRDWDAWRDRMPGADPSVVHVAGVCTVPSSSVELKLELGNEGIVDDPELIALELTSSRPDIGDTMMAEKAVSWSGQVADTVIRVRIQGEATANKDVRDVH